MYLARDSAESLDKLVSTHDDEIVLKHYDEYKYSPLETALLKFFKFLPVLSFFPTFSLLKKKTAFSPLYILENR